MTFAELMVVIAILSIVLLVTLGVSRGWIDRQAGRSAVYQLQSHMQLARAQAITRNQPVMFLVNDVTRELQVFDLNDPGNTSDDILLAEMVLSPIVSFDRPDAGLPITLYREGPARYQATFAPRGHVTIGDGEVVLKGSQGAYHKVSVSASGGVAVKRWNGSGWTTEGL